MNDWAMFFMGFITGASAMAISATIRFIQADQKRLAPKVGALEVVEQLQRIAEGKTTIAGVYAAGNEGYEIVINNGWSIDLAWDDGWLTYVVRAASPDGRWGVHDVDDWPDDPLELLEKIDPALIGLFTLKVQDAIAERRRTFVTEG